jgi:hypothetical protein
MLTGMRSLIADRRADSHTLIDVPGLESPVRVRIDRRARRVSLRIDAQARAAVALAPPGTSTRAITRFCRQHAAWLAARLARLAPSVSLQPGAEVPVFGAPHRLVHIGPRGRPVTLAEGEIRVAGPAAHVTRRAVDGLKRHARTWLADRSADHAARLDVAVGAVSVRQARTRWGSCAPGGRLSFNWRLVFAPDWVADYVAAHEVAHIVHPHHGPAFWQAVGELHDAVAPARAWLNAHGAGLFRYAPDAG